jgi:hypothetical protein
LLFLKNYLLNNFFLPAAANPIIPDPNSSIVAGSGTGEAPLFGSPCSGGFSNGLKTAKAVIHLPF